MFSDKTYIQKRCSGYIKWRKFKKKKKQKQQQNINQQL